MSLLNSSCTKMNMQPFFGRQRSRTPRYYENSGIYENFNYCENKSPQICSPHDICLGNDIQPICTANITSEDLAFSSPEDVGNQRSPNTRFEQEIGLDDNSYFSGKEEKERPTLQYSVHAKAFSKAVSNVGRNRARSPHPGRARPSYERESIKFRESRRSSDPLRFTGNIPSSSEEDSDSFLKSLSLEGGASPIRFKSQIGDRSDYESTTKVSIPSRASSQKFGANLPKARPSYRRARSSDFKRKRQRQGPFPSLDPESASEELTPRSGHQNNSPSIVSLGFMTETLYEKLVNPRKTLSEMICGKSTPSSQNVEILFRQPQRRFMRISDSRSTDSENQNEQMLPERLPLKWCTLEEIVKRTTHPCYPDEQTKKILFMCWRGFCSRKELLEALKNQWEKRHLPDDFYDYTQSEKVDEEKAKRIISIKVLNLLRYWLHYFFDDFEGGGCEDLRDLEVWARSVTRNNKDTMTKVAVDKILKEIRFIRSGTRPIPRNLGFHIYPRHLWDIDTTPGNIFNVPNEEIARQMCLIDHEIFASIRPHEFLGQSWKKKNREIVAPNLTKIIRHFSEISCGIQAMILQEKNLTNRVSVLSRLFKICNYLKCYGNLNSLFAIMTGIRATPIYRLKKTFKALKPKYTRLFSRFDKLLRMDKGQKNLRECMSDLVQPGIPYIGLFLKDILFIDEGNVDFKRGKINFSKYTLLNERIAWCLLFQNYPYRFRELEKVQKELMSYFKIIDEEFLYSLSRTLEPPTDLA